MNSKMQNIRQASLDILKPNPRDLEHGLELHRNSVVIDTYGFGPSPARNTAILEQALKDGVTDTELKDLREGMLMLRQLTDPAEQAEYKEAWNEAGVTCIIRNAGEETQAPLTMLKRMARFIHVTDIMRDFVPKAVNAEDILTAHQANRHCFCLTCNGVPLDQQWHTAQSELAYIELFYQLGCRMMHLTYNRRNMLGDGCAEESNAGLSDFGRMAIAELNRVGVIVDVAHSGWQTSLEAARASTKPIVASHTTCDAMYHHCRAKPDDVIRAILDTGGLIGICCVAGFLGGDGSIKALLDHIDYMVKKFGADSVAIGTDTAYTSSLDNNQPPFEMPYRQPRFAYFWPEGSVAQPQWNNPHKLMTLNWFSWPMFTVGMVQHGHKDQDIRKILGENMLRVLRANSPG